MARREIRQEVFAFTADPIPHCGSLDRLSGLIDWSTLDRLLAVWYDLSDVKLAEALEDRASF